MNDVINKRINTNLDKSNMQGAISSFPNQINKSFEIMSNWTSIKEYKGIKQIMILGMGGSAIGGDVARLIARNQCLVPIIVNRSYTIPKWVNSNTLILASSYSGNTEETLSSFSKCRERKCPILVLSTGGILSQHSDAMKLDRVEIPMGYQPRAALGFSFSLILLVLEHLGFIDHIVTEDVKTSITSLEKLSIECSQDGNSALAIAKKIHRTCPIIYGSEDLTCVAALRFRGQLAENAKMLSFHHQIPEQNHNEIEGWTVNNHIMNLFSIFWLRDIDEDSGTRARMDISSSILETLPELQINISQSGKNRVERLLKLIHYTDWISYYASLLNNVDPTPVIRIQELKARIAKI